MLEIKRIKSKEEAILLTRELWLWMKENRETDKSKWPGWEKYGPMKHFCPCCQYVTDLHEGGPYFILDDIVCINSCPLINIWPAKLDTGCVPCCRKKSPFYGFEGDTTTAYKALKVVDKMVKAIENEVDRLQL